MTTIRHLKAQLSSLEARTCSQAEKLTTLLEVGCAYFELVLGLISDIQETDYRVLAAYPVGLIEGGSVFALEETICTITHETDKVTKFSKASGTQWALHPAYEKFAIETYIGIAYRCETGQSGTLNFSSPTALGRNFTDKDSKALKLLKESLLKILQS